MPLVVSQYYVMNEFCKKDAISYYLYGMEITYSWLEGGV